jgi:hypothetical protein
MAQSASLGETARRSIDIWLAFSQQARRDDPEYLDVWTAYSGALAALTMALRDQSDGQMRQAAADMVAAVIDMAGDFARLPEVAEAMSPLYRPGAGPAGTGGWDAAQILDAHDRALAAVRDYMAALEADTQRLQ